MATDLGPWSPLSPTEVSALFRAESGPRLWWIAGGEALDLFVGQRTRAHEDIDVSILREDAPLLHHMLPGWDLRLAHAGILTPWDGTPIASPYNGLWCRPSAEHDWSLQVMLEEGTQATWVCRRHGDLSLPMAQVVRRSDGDLPYMAPQVQLFMKAKDPRPKDHADFAVVAPRLALEQWAWLLDALERHYPGHPWLEERPAR